jgi:hypothetical protein
MSDNFLVLVPEDPYFVPAAESHEPACRLLERAVPKADDVTISVSDFPQVIMYGFPETTCPHCGAAVDDDWWAGEVSAAFEEEFDNLIVRMPCCHRASSLNDLNYEEAGGFARFELSATNPGQDIDIEVKAALERVLGTPLRRLRLHL